MSEVDEILSKKILTRSMRKKILNFIEKHSMSIEDFDPKFRPRIAEILMGPEPKLETKKSKKRKKPEEDFNNDDAPPSKKQKLEMKNLLKELIKKDIEMRKEKNFIDVIFYKKPSSKNDVVILDEDEDDEDNDEEDGEIHEEDCDCEKCDENYDPEEVDDEEEQFRKDFLTIIGQSINKNKELNLECIETEEEKKQIKELYEQIKNMNNVKMPLKIKVLTSELPIKVKAMIVKKLEDMSKHMDSGGDGRKFNDWVESVLKIPFNKYCSMPISNKAPKNEVGDFLNNFYNNLDKAIYGQKKVKQALTETIAKWISNPNVKGHALAVVGPPGIGKTSLIREGLAKGLNRPFCSMSLSGMHDEAYLTGFAMTYEGSQEGRIAKMLINSNCMNPIIYMDELDKVDTNRHGMSMMNKLIEITDFSQNHEFEDLYFQDVKLDLSKCIFVFSLNHLENVDPILRDRLEVIHVKGFDTKEKVKIAMEYLIPAEIKQIGLEQDQIIFDEKIIRYIIVQLDDEEGVRGLKKAINKICRTLNLLQFTNKNTEFNKTYELPVKVTEDIVNKILTRPDKPFLSMYM